MDSIYQSQFQNQVGTEERFQEFVWRILNGRFHSGRDSHIYHAFLMSGMLHTSQVRGGVSAEDCSRISYYIIVLACPHVRAWLSPYLAGR